MVFRAESIDPTHGSASADIQVSQARRGDPAWVFDEETVHIHHIKRAVRAGANLDRAKPIVGRGEELRLRFIIGAATAQA